ncbi:MAG: hypothetical protein LBG93_01625 [Treponema sp.]|jgi:hypothetical protein|nr:hypothetical protein [Treponema sp.]
MKRRTTMKSKNLWFGLLMITFSATLLTGCARDNDSEVLGRWFHQAWVGRSHNSTTITFYADGRFNLELRPSWGTGSPYAGTFTARNGRMTLTFDDDHARGFFSPDGTTIIVGVSLLLSGGELFSYKGEAVTITYAVGGDTLRLDWDYWGMAYDIGSQTFSRL